MANLNSARYFAYDARPLEEAGERQRFLLSEADVRTIVDGLADAWRGIVRARVQDAMVPPSKRIPEDDDPGTCLFPLTTLKGRVSSFESSRCYLSTIGNRWRQQSDFVEGD